MFVNVRLYGTLRRLPNPETPGIWKGNIPKGYTINELITILGTKSGEVAVSCINGNPCPFETEIPDSAGLYL